MLFKLKDTFIDNYKNKDPNFGFNGLGKLTYHRTYSRLKENGEKEEWYETIRRVIEGTYSIQKEHIEKYNLGWDENKAQESAQEMYDRMFSMKFLPPGRGLTKPIGHVKEYKLLETYTIITTTQKIERFDKVYNVTISIQILQNDYLRLN
ncbi:MAG: hypothetical protein ACOCV1_05870 [Bacillota bacterium]